MSDRFEHPPRFPERFNMADYFLDARVREGKGDRPAIRVGDRTWTYRGVQEMADRCGHALRDRGEVDPAAPQDLELSRLTGDGFVSRVYELAELGLSDLAP